MGDGILGHARVKAVHGGGDTVWSVCECGWEGDLRAFDRHAADELVVRLAEAGRKISDDREQRWMLRQRLDNALGRLSEARDLLVAIRPWVGALPADLEVRRAAVERTLILPKPETEEEVRPSVEAEAAEAAGFVSSEPFFSPEALREANRALGRSLHHAQSEQARMEREYEIAGEEWAVRMSEVTLVLKKVLGWPVPQGTVESKVLPRWLAEAAREALAGRQMKLMGCGHPESDVVQDGEGTAYCGACEDELSEPPTDATTDGSPAEMGAQVGGGSLSVWVHGTPARDWEQVAEYLRGDAHDRSKVQLMLDGRFYGLREVGE